MSAITVGGCQFDLDEDGFLADPATWNEGVARYFATAEGITDLTEDHWKVINYLRDYYAQFGTNPVIRSLCKDTGFGLTYIYQLFPSGPAKCACKLAGLPKPTGCA